MKKIRRFLAKGLAMAALSVSILAVSGTAEATSPATGEWKKDSKGWYYQYKDGSYIQSDWLQYNGKWYFFNKSGYMLKGWAKLQNKWYYFGSDGIMSTGWKQLGGKWYYFGSDGIMSTGWKRLGGEWYYFNKSGVMQTGKKTIGGLEYLFNSEGRMTIQGFKISDIPDEAFRQYVGDELDTDKDGKIGVKEIQAVTKLTLTGYEIIRPGVAPVLYPVGDAKKLTGIGFFTELRELRLNNMDALETVDLSSLKKLEFFDIDLDNMSNMTVRTEKCESLKTVGLMGVNLDNITFPTGMTELHLLNCKTPSQLDFGSYSLLKNLDVEFMRTDERIAVVSSINLSKNTQLETLTLINTGLTALNLSKNTALAYMYIANDSDEQNWNSLDLSKNTNLKVLNLNGFSLPSLALTKNTALTDLRLSSCKISSLDLSKNTGLINLIINKCSLGETLNLAKNTSLYCLKCTDSGLKSLDLSKNTKLTHVDCSENELTDLNLANLKSLTYLNCGYNSLTSLSIPDSHKLAYLNCDNEELDTFDVTNTPFIRYAVHYGEFGETPGGHTGFLVNGIVILLNQNTEISGDSDEAISGWVITVTIKTQKNTGSVEYDKPKVYYKDGVLLKGWQQIDSKWYYLDEDGYAVCEEYIKGYWLNKNGVWANTAIASWKKNKNGWWYGDTTGWYAKDQGLMIDGKWYYFGEDGYMIEY